ncbi:MAG: hypothetical protein PHD76_07115 [Methylacidiphilales bacterium]|nr:hypothetical protein [Candidatus Methylacidiphilales bacterium]
MNRAAGICAGLILFLAIGVVQLRAEHDATICTPFACVELTVPTGFFKGELKDHADVKRDLMSRGIKFPVGSEVRYWPGSKKLVIRNDSEEIEKVKALLAEPRRLSYKIGTR